MADVEPVVDPTKYMNPSSMRIVIKEKTPSCLIEKKLSSSTKDVNMNKAEKISNTQPSNDVETPDKDLSRYVNFDPVPPSHTILSKTASLPRRTNGKLSVITQPPVLLGDDSKEMLVKARANLGTAEVTRRYPLLPPDVRSKYNRYTYIEGIKPIPSNTLEWKVPLLQNKNKQVIEEHLHKLFVEQQKREVEYRLREQERIERERLEATPEWKRPLVRQKEERKKLEQMRRQEQEQRQLMEQKKFQSLPPWQQELLLRKKEQQRLDSLPEWQRDLVIKKRVANYRKTFEAK